MDPLIRAASLSPHVRRLPRRDDRAPARDETATPPVPPAAPPPAVHTEAQHAWQRQAEQELVTARERAQREGHAQGLDDAQAAYREKLQHLDDLIRNAGAALAAQIDGLEDIAVGIAFETLVKWLGDALVTPAGVQAMVAQVLAHARDHEKLVVRLSPRDHLLLQPHAPAPGVELVPDERITPGGCLVDTAEGSLDARLETRIRILRDVLLRVRAGRRDEEH